MIRAGRKQAPPNWQGMATVTGTSPWEVRRDGEDEPIPASIVLAPAPIVGDRVWCQTSGSGAAKQLIIIGKAV